MAEREPEGWRNLRMGVFFLATAAVLFAALFVVGTNARLFERKYELKAYLPNAQQLDKGSMVALSGLEVGKIKSIRFVRRDDGRNIELTLQLPLHSRDQITTSSVASVRTVGVLGDRFIDITMGQPGEEPLEEDAEIPILIPTDWPATLQKAASGLDDFLAMIKSASEAVAKLDQGEGTLGVLLNDRQTAEHFRATAADLASVSHALKTGEGSLGRLITDDAMARSLEHAVSRFDSLVTVAVEGDGLMARLLGDSTLADHVARAAAGADSVMWDLREGDGTAARLLRQDELYREMLATMEQVHALVAKIQEHPERYLSISLF